MHAVVSVIVPCFNYGRFLERCVQSLLAQTYEQWECIIVDDGSSDDTPEVCSRLSRSDARIRCVRQQNAGLSAARNTGVREARGQFVQLLDADDLLEPEKLRVQVRFFDRHADAEVVFGPAGLFEDGEADGARPWPAKDAGLQDPLAGFVGENLFPVHAALVRRTVFDAVGLFDEGLRAHEDWDFWLRCLLLKKRFAFVSAAEDRALVRQHAASMSGSRELMLRTAVTVRERLREQLPPALQNLNATRLGEAKWRLGLQLVREGRRSEGWRLYREGLRASRQTFSAIVRLPLVFPVVAKALQLSRRLLG